MGVVLLLELLKDVSSMLWSSLPLVLSFLLRRLFLLSDFLFFSFLRFFSFLLRLLLEGDELSSEVSSDDSETELRLFLRFEEIDPSCWR